MLQSGRQFTIRHWLSIQGAKWRFAKYFLSTTFRTSKKVVYSLKSDVLDRASERRKTGEVLHWARHNFIDSWVPLLFSTCRMALLPSQLHASMSWLWVKRRRVIRTERYLTGPVTFTLCRKCSNIVFNIRLKPNAQMRRRLREHDRTQGDSENFRLTWSKRCVLLIELPTQSPLTAKQLSCEY